MFIVTICNQIIVINLVVSSFLGSVKHVVGNTEWMDITIQRETDISVQYLFQQGKCFNEIQ